MSIPNKPRAWVTWVLLGAVAVVAVLPLLTGAADHLDEPFVGADGEAESLVHELNPGYEPWLSPVFELPSGEVESGLFALQAAIGAGIVGYAFGVVRTRSRLRTETEAGPETRAGTETGAGLSPGTAEPEPNDDASER